jgi:hypothetical protein
VRLFFPFVFFCYLAFGCCYTSASDAAEHIMSQSALHFSEPAPRSFTADMSKDEYAGKLSDVRDEIDERYARLAGTLGETGLEELKKAQSAWEVFVSKYELALGNMLNSTIKVYYGVKGRERFTNVYREITLTLHRHRMIDLARWAAPGSKRTSFKSDVLEEEWVKSFNILGPSVIYLTPERNRPDQYAVENAWRNYLSAQLDFLRVLHDHYEKSVEDEKQLMMNRMFDLMSLQEEGLLFFRSEREE